MAGKSALQSLTTLVSGTAGAQVITSVSMLLLARWYAPSSFGLFSVVTAGATCLSSVLGLKLDFALDQIRKSTERKRLMRSATTLTLAGTLLMSLAVMSLRSALPSEYRIVAILTPLHAASLSLYTLLTRWFTLAGDFRVIAARGLWLSLGTAGLQLGLGLLGLNLGLVLGAMIARWAISGVMLQRAVGGAILASPRELLAHLRLFWRLPVIVTPSTFINAVSLNALPVVFALHFGSTVAGLYSVAAQVVFLPAALISGAASQVVLQGEQNPRGEDQRRNLVMVLTLLGAGALGLLVVAALLGPAIPKILGQNWGEAVPMLFPLAVASASMIVGSPLHSIWETRGKYAELALWFTARFAALATALGVCIRNQFSASVFVWTFALVHAVFYIYSTIRCLRLSLKLQRGTGVGVGDI